MNKKENRKYFDILEINPDASLEEVHRAYQHLNKVYTTDSIATIPIDDELSSQEKAAILHQLEEAYQNIVDFLERKRRKKRFKKTKAIEEMPQAVAEKEVAQVKVEIDLEEHKVDVAEEETVDIPPIVVTFEPVQEEPEPIRRVQLPETEEPELSASPEQKEEKEIFLDDIPIEEKAEQRVEINLNDSPLETEEEEGSGIDLDSIKIADQDEAEAPPINFKKEREKLGLSIEEVSIQTAIPTKTISHIEQEKFHKLPDGGLLRWSVVTYAKALSLDSKTAADQYMKKYRAWKSK